MVFKCLLLCFLHSTVTCVLHVCSAGACYTNVVWCYTNAAQF